MIDWKYGDKVVCKISHTDQLGCVFNKGDVFTVSEVRTVSELKKIYRNCMLIKDDAVYARFKEIEGHHWFGSVYFEKVVDKGSDVGMGMLMDILKRNTTKITEFA